MNANREAGASSGGLPERVCVLDLETSKLVRGDLDKMPLAFVGTMVYELRGDGSYRPGPHRCFLPGEMGALEELLRGFEGVVLGHNILNFDYEVLEPRLSLAGVREKTVDTLGFLYEKRCTEPMFGGGTSSSLQGLSLDNLARMNLGRGKKAGVSGRSIPKMWREGRRDEVVAYNKEDLVLTFELWRCMVGGRTVVVEEERDEPQRHVPPYMSAAEEERVYAPGRIEIFEEDLPRLTGQRPLYNTRLVRINGGPPLDEPPPDAEPEPNHWYLGAFARHYLREDQMVISDPRMDEYGTGDWGFPYPADIFEFSVWQEGPTFPARRAPGEKLEDMDDFF